MIDNNSPFGIKKKSSLKFQKESKGTSILNSVQEQSLNLRSASNNIGDKTPGKKLKLLDEIAPRFQRGNSMKTMNQFSCAVNVPTMLSEKGFFQRKKTFEVFVKQGDRFFNHNDSTKVSLMQRTARNSHSINLLLNHQSNYGRKNEEFIHQEYKKLERRGSKGVILTNEICSKSYYDYIIKRSKVKKDLDKFLSNNKLCPISSLVQKFDYYIMDKFMKVDTDENQLLSKFSQKHSLDLSQFQLHNYRHSPNHQTSSTKRSYFNQKGHSNQRSDSNQIQLVQEQQQYTKKKIPFYILQFNNVVHQDQPSLCDKKSRQIFTSPQHENQFKQEDNYAVLNANSSIANNNCGKIQLLSNNIKSKINQKTISSLSRLPFQKNNIFKQINMDSKQINMACSNQEQNESKIYKEGITNKEHNQNNEQNQNNKYNENNQQNQNIGQNNINREYTNKKQNQNQNKEQNTITQYPLVKDGNNVNIMQKVIKDGQYLTSQVLKGKEKVQIVRKEGNLQGQNLIVEDRNNQQLNIQGMKKRTLSQPQIYCQSTLYEELDNQIQAKERNLRENNYATLDFYLKIIKQIDNKQFQRVDKEMLREQITKNSLLKASQQVKHQRSQSQVAARRNQYNFKAESPYSIEDCNVIFKYQHQLPFIYIHILNTYFSMQSHIITINTIL